MAGSTLTTFDAILKNQYLGPIREQLNNSSVLYSRLEKNEDSVVGKNFTIPLHYGRNEGVGARAEGGALPTAGNQAYKECIVPMRYQYGRIQLTGPTIKAARSNEGAFLRAVDSEMRGLEKDMKSSMNRQAFGDGTGLLASVAASGSSTSTVVVDSTAKLRIGMPVDIIIKTTGLATAGVAGTTVASITDGTTFVISDELAGTPAATYGVYLAGSRGNEMMGLGGIVSDTATLQGLEVSSYPWWKATIQANSGTARAITDSLIQEAIDTLESKSSGMCSAMYTSFGVRRAYQALLTNTKQLVNTQELQGGYKAISYLGGSHGVIPIIADKDAPAGKIFCVDENELSIYRLADFDWMQEDGAILSRVSGYDAYEAVLYVYQELGTSMRNAHVLIDDITEA